MKHREDGHEALDEVDTLNNKLRAGAIDLGNRGHTDEAADQTPLQNMENIFLSSQDGTSQRGR